MEDEAPRDRGSVRYAFGLGWAVAEIRDRYQANRYDTRPWDREGVQRGSFGIDRGQARQHWKAPRSL